MTSDLLFVYGTLMRGYSHPMARLKRVIVGADTPSHVTRSSIGFSTNMVG